MEHESEVLISPESQAIMLYQLAVQTANMIVDKSDPQDPLPRLREALGDAFSLRLKEVIRLRLQELFSKEFPPRDSTYFATISQSLDEMCRLYYSLFCSPS